MKILYQIPSKMPDVLLNNMVTYVESEIKHTAQIANDVEDLNVRSLWQHGYLGMNGFLVSCIEHDGISQQNLFWI